MTVFLLGRLGVWVQSHCIAGRRKAAGNQGFPPMLRLITTMQGRRKPEL
jgi:hypothetical protein